MKSFTYLLIAIFCYNGTIGIYIVTVFLLLLMQKNNSVKSIIKNILIAGILELIVISLNFIQIKIVCNYMGITQNRLSLNIIDHFIYIALNCGRVFLNQDPQLFPQYLFLIFLMLTLIPVIYCIIKENNSNFLIRLMLFLFISLFTSFGIHIFSLSSFGAGRLHVSVRNDNWTYFCYNIYIYFDFRK